MGGAELNTVDIIGLLEDQDKRIYACEHNKMLFALYYYAKDIRLSEVRNLLALSFKKHLHNKHWV